MTVISAQSAPINVPKTPPLPPLNEAAQQALDTLKSITDPAVKEAAAREQVERATSLAAEQLKALRMMGIDDANTAKGILKRLDSVTQTYADAQKALAASRNEGAPGDVDGDIDLVDQAKQIGAQLGEISAHSQDYALLAGEVQAAAIEAQSIIERAGNANEKSSGRNRLVSLTNAIFDGAKAISATGNPARSLLALDLSV